jgi:ABC-type multidrug transport system fused ATPase/permease subunit
LNLTPTQVVPPPRHPPPPLRPIARLVPYVRQSWQFAGLTLVFGVAGFLLSFVYPSIIGAIVDLIHPSSPISRQEQLDTVWRLTALSAVSGLGHALVLYGRGHFNVRLGSGVMAALRRDLFEHLQLLSSHFYARQRTGTVLARVVHDVHDATSIIYAGGVVVALDASQLAVAFTLLVGIDLKLALACVVIFPIYGVLFRVMNPRVRLAGERVRQQFARISGDVAERLSGHSVIKTYTAEPREARRFAEQVQEHRRLVIAESHEGHLVAAFGEIFVHLGTTIVIGYGGWLAIKGEMSAGTLTRFLGYVVLLYGPVRRLAELNMTYQSSLSAMQRIFGLLDTRPAVVEIAHPRRAPPTHGRVVFEQVRFRYATTSDEARIAREDDRADRESSGEARWVLDGVSLNVARGERIAVVGASGAGKTTLLSLLPRLYDVTQGRILVDGTDIREFGLAALRSAIGIVQQESFLFTGSIRENIAYGRVDASPEEIIEAAVAAHAHEFIQKFDEKYETLLGERGVNLSGGQRQRISIARALLKNPRILILDEATSALDAESEAIVQAALERLMSGRTCFVIAHRLSTIVSADRIAVLENGRIVELGCHAELLSLRGRYARLLRQQPGVGLVAP